MRDDFMELLVENEVPYEVNRSGRLNRADSITVYSKTKRRGKFGRPYLRVSGFGRLDGRFHVTTDGFQKHVNFIQLIKMVEDFNK